MKSEEEIEGKLQYLREVAAKPDTIGLATFKHDVVDLLEELFKRQVRNQLTSSGCDAIRYDSGGIAGL